MSLQSWFSCRFRPAKAREIIAGVLSSRLGGVAYNADKMSVLSREVADEIKQRLKGKNSTWHVLVIPDRAQDDDALELNHAVGNTASAAHSS
jgi:hypothetical protein